MKTTQVDKSYHTNSSLSTNVSATAAAISDVVLGEIERSSSEITGFWQIASHCLERLRSRDAGAVREQTLSAVAELMLRHVVPGDYGATGFEPWPGSVEERVTRIDAAWDELGRTPDIVDPICWFAKLDS